MRRRLATLTSVLSLAAPLALRAQNLVTNPSFEATPAPAGGFATYQTGQTFGGWGVAAGSVDLIGNGYWQAADGVQSLDLDGNSPGAISQTLATQVGQRYDLSFAMAGNLAGGAAIKTLNVLWGGTSVGTFSFDVTGHSFASMGYETMFLRGLVATGASTQLTFQSVDAGSSATGPVLDAISVVAANSTVPEPSSWALVGAGLLGLAGSAARRRRRAAA